ncbi:hypothetical protein Tco_0393949 [Tanacetum coccineum]
MKYGHEMEHYLEFIDNELWKVIQMGKLQEENSTGKGRPNFNSVRTNINAGTGTNINSVRPKVNVVSPKVNTIRFRQPIPNKTSNSSSPKRPQMNQMTQRRDFSKSYSSVRRPFEKTTAQMSHSYAVMGNWGSAVKTSASYNWRNNRPNFHYNSGPTFNRTVNAKGTSTEEHGSSEELTVQCTSQTPNSIASEEKRLREVELIVSTIIGMKVIGTKLWSTEIKEMKEYGFGTTSQTEQGSNLSSSQANEHLYRFHDRFPHVLNCPRPDIMYVVCVCSRFPRASPFDLEAFSDSDYGGSNLDRKITTAAYGAAVVKLLWASIVGSKQFCGLLRQFHEYQDPH